MKRRLVPYAGAERPKHIAPRIQPSGAELVERMIIEELGILNRKISIEQTKLALLEKQLAEIRSAR